MLSYTGDSAAEDMLCNALDSLFKTTKNFKPQVIVVESSNNTKYAHKYRKHDFNVIRIDEPFNYNRFLNKGIAEVDKDSEFVILANNDLIFHNGWLDELVSASDEHDLDVASPFNPHNWEPHKPFANEKIKFGTRTSYEFCGWCVMFRKDTLDAILPLDENFVFEFQDNDIVERLKMRGSYRMALVCTSHVSHLCNGSHRFIKDRIKMIDEAAATFNRKYLAVPCFIINRDQLTWPRNMIPHIERLRLRPIIIDNASTYPPLLDWYKETHVEVIRLKENLGHRSPWTSGMVDAIVKGRFYVVTDPDLDLSGVPDNSMEHLVDLLNRYPTITKAGFSIRIDDIPATCPLYRKILEWERPFWVRMRDGICYDAPVDTTFAVYDKARALNLKDNNKFVKAVRAKKPYSVKHLPFYWTKYTFDEEAHYYLTHANSSSTMAQYLKPLIEQFENDNHSQS